MAAPLFRGPCVECGADVFSRSNAVRTCGPKCGYILRAKTQTGRSRYQTVVVSSPGVIVGDAPTIPPDHVYVPPAPAPPKPLVPPLNFGEGGRVVLDAGQRGLRSRTHLIIPDCQVHEGVPTEHLEWVGKYVASKRPDVIVCIGDFADMSSLCSFDKGKKQFEGRRYVKDIESARAAMDRLTAEWRNIANYTPRMVFCLGNHESVRADAEILTISGWVAAADLKMTDLVASFPVETGAIVFSTPLAISMSDDVPLIQVSGGKLKYEVVSATHRLVYAGALRQVSIGEELDGRLFRHAGSFLGTISSQPNLVRVVTWVVMDGTVVRGPGAKMRVQWRLALPRKIEKLQCALTALGVPFTARPDTMSKVGKLPVTKICIYGDAARMVVAEMKSGEKALPDKYAHLDDAGFNTLIEAILNTDGMMHDSGIQWTTTSKNDLDIVQAACVLHGRPAAYATYEGAGGFSGKHKTQYHLRIYDMMRMKPRPAVVSHAGVGTVVSIATEHGTLVTRLNGSVSFTGNSRIERAVEEAAILEGTIGLHDLGYEAFGWEVHPFLEVVKIDGIEYSHYFTSGVMGRPIISAAALLRARQGSAIQGHVQHCDVSFHQKTQNIAILAGTCYLHDEDYLGLQGNNQRRQIVMLYEVDNGHFDPLFISLAYLKRRFGS